MPQLPQNNINFAEYNNENENYRTEKSACYSKIFSEALDITTTDLILFQDKTIPEEQWPLIFNLLASIDMPVEQLVTQEEKEKYDVEKYKLVIRIKISDYTYKSQLLSALTILRYMWEGDFGDNIIDKYEEIINTYPEAILLDAFQAACYSSNDFDNHTLHNHGYTEILTKEELYNNLAKGNHNVYTYGNNNRLNEIWKKGSYKRWAKTTIKTYESLVKIGEEKLKKVFVVGGDVEYANWLDDFKITENFDEADLIMFTGGEDVDPSLYNEPSHPRTYSNLSRDKREKSLFNKAVKTGKPIIGICRGSQFSCIMSGGKLVQHQENPGRHYINLNDGSDPICVTSTHHQAQYPFNLPRWDYEIIGWTNNQLLYHQNGSGEEMNPPKECEIVEYFKTKALAIQAHPEHEFWQTHYKTDLIKIKEIFHNFFNKYHKQ